MKKSAITIFLLLVGLTFNAMAQISPADKLFEQYNGQDGFTTVHITKELFNMMSQIQVEGDEEAQEVLKAAEGLEHIRILMCDKKENSKDFKAFRSQLQKSMNLDGYVELMVVKEQEEEVNFVVRKEGKMIKELLMLIDNEDEAGFISIIGDIDMKTIGNITKGMQIKGMENLDKIQE